MLLLWFSDAAVGTPIIRIIAVQMGVISQIHFQKNKRIAEPFESLETKRKRLVLWKLR